jgi:hypothetical protein
MSDIVAVADETAATRMVRAAETALGTQSRSGSDSLGPFTVGWNASVFFANGNIDLIPPNVIRIDNGELHYSLGFSISLDLNSFLPSFCLPRVCIRIPFIGRVCTPRICISWPTITVPVSHSGIVRFAADFSLNPHLDGSDWKIDLVVVGIPFLQIGPEAAAILLAIGAAVSLAALGIPFIGPLIALGVAAVVAAIAVAGVTGLLGPILTPFVSGLTFNIYSQPRLFPVLPAAGVLDPAVNVNIDTLSASVVRSDEDELVIAVDISAP